MAQWRRRKLTWFILYNNSLIRIRYLRKKLFQRDVRRQMNKYLQLLQNSKQILKEIFLAMKDILETKYFFLSRIKDPFSHINIMISIYFFRITTDIRCKFNILPQLGKQLMHMVTLWTLREPPHTLPQHLIQERKLEYLNFIIGHFCTYIKGKSKYITIENNDFVLFFDYF